MDTSSTVCFHARVKKPSNVAPAPPSEISVLAAKIRGAALFLLASRHSLKDFVEKCGLHKNSVMRIKALRPGPSGEWAWNPQVDTLEKLERLIRYAEAMGYVHGLNTPYEPPLPSRPGRSYAARAPVTKPAKRTRAPAAPQPRPPRPSKTAGRHQVGNGARKPATV